MAEGSEDAYVRTWGGWGAGGSSTGQQRVGAQRVGTQGGDAGRGRSRATAQGGESTLTPSMVRVLSPMGSECSPH